MVNEIRAVFLVKMGDDLAVRAGAEDMTSALEPGAFLDVIEELPVGDGDDAAVFVGEGLAAVAEADDAQSAVDEADPGFEKRAFFVRAASEHGLRHELQGMPQRRWVGEGGV